MNNHDPTDKCPIIKWDELIERAKLNGSAELYHELKKYAAWFQAFRGGFNQADYPPVVIAYLTNLTKRTGKRGRPPRSEWQELVYRDSYEQNRLLYEITKKNNGKIVDKNGKEWNVIGKPSDLAIEDLADNMNRSVGAATDAINPRRKEKYRKKRTE